MLAQHDSLADGPHVAGSAAQLAATAPPSPIADPSRATASPARGSNPSRPQPSASTNTQHAGRDPTRRSYSLAHESSKREPARTHTDTWASPCVASMRTDEPVRRRRLRYGRTMSLVEHARSLAATLPTRRAAHDAARQLDPEVITELRATGLFGCLLPRELGGSELDPASYVELLETLATGDAATAWVVMTASTSTLLAPYLDKATATAIWTPHSADGATNAPVLAGVFAPSGKLVDGTLTGRWAYASGCRHAAWFALGALADRHHVVCFVPARDVQIVDNWDTLGLAGTGSHDVVVEARAVSSAHVTSVFDRAPWATGALYQVPLFGLLAAGIAACGLGIARAALGHAAAKLASEREVPSPQLARYATLRADLDGARAYLRATCTRAARGPVDGVMRGELRLAASATAHRCAEVVRGAFHLGGGAAARTGHPLGNALRDIETVLTHRMVVDRVLPAAARAILGLGAIPPDL